MTDEKETSTSEDKLSEKKKDLFSLAKQIITENEDIVFIEDVAVHCGVAKSTFYSYFPNSSDEMNELKEKLRKNKIMLKLKLRKKWLAADNPTLNVCLYKLLSNEHERELLADRVHQDGENINYNFDAESKDEYEELMQYTNSWKGQK